MSRTAPLSLILLLAACGSKTSQPTQPPAHAEPVAHESELLKLSLTPEAARRIGIVTAQVGKGDMQNMLATSGEIVVPNSAGGVPTGALSNLAQIGSSQAAADGEVARSRAQVRLARTAMDRATQLVAEEAGSVRGRDEAAAALATAQAQADVAMQQRRLLGPAIASLGRQSSLWVRVPLSGSDAAMAVGSSPARVSAMGGDAGQRSALPVSAPPSANAMAGTVDLYYRIDNRDRAYRVGQRVAVAIPVGQRSAGLSVPISAIVYDIDGGSWIYQGDGPHAYVRQRIEIASISDGQAIVARGLKPGTAVVTQGAMELFGTEFGVAH